MVHFLFIMDRLYYIQFVTFTKVELKKFYQWAYIENWIFLHVEEVHSLSFEDCMLTWACVYQGLIDCNWIRISFQPLYNVGGNTKKAHLKPFSVKYIILGTECIFLLQCTLLFPLHCLVYYGIWQQIDYFWHTRTHTHVNEFICNQFFLNSVYQVGIACTYNSSRHIHIFCVLYYALPFKWIRHWLSIDSSLPLFVWHCYSNVINNRNVMISES